MRPSARMMTKVGAVLRGTSSTTAAGTVTLSFASVETGIPCALQPSNPRQKVSEPGRVPVPAFTFYARQPLDLRLGDRVVVDGTAYEVQSLGDGGGRGVTWEAGVDLDRGRD